MNGNKKSIVIIKKRMKRVVYREGMYNELHGNDATIHQPRRHDVANVPKESVFMPCRQSRPVHALETCESRGTGQARARTKLVCAERLKLLIYHTSGTELH
jgi:hypothetical protein